MKKTVISLSIATMLMGALTGCGAGNDAQGLDRNGGQFGTQNELFDTNGRTGLGINAHSPHVGENNKFGNNNNHMGLRAQNAQNQNGTNALETGEVGQFDDVTEDAWYSEDIQWARKYNIMKGVGDNKFAPNEPLTRAHMATLVRNMANEGYIFVFNEEDLAEWGVVPEDEVPADDTTPTDETPVDQTPDTTTPTT